MKTSRLTKLKIISVLFLLSASITYGHNIGSIYGIIKDAETKEPIPYANISIDKTVLGTNTDLNGNFKLRNIHFGEYTLKITHLNYQIIVKTVSLEKDSLYIEILLNPATLNFDEVSIEAERPYSTASIKNIRNIDLDIRPSRSSQDLLRLAPGLVIAQHAGGGKAEQIFLRGFDCDHGTDVAIDVDGIPVNMVSHGHGQGYADLHFLMPEIVEAIDVYKGPYFAKFGNFATAGAVSFKTRDILENNMFKIEGGQFNTQKATMLYQMQEGGVEQNAYVGAQYYYTDGPFKSPQELQRMNVFGKYFSQLNHNSKIAISLSSFSSAWDASGQIPDRAVVNNIIDRFGGIDNLEGGITGRQDANIKYTLIGESNEEFVIQGYMSSYNFKLFSNFTYFLEDSLNGDMLEQNDDRKIYGINTNYKRLSELCGKPVITTLGAGYRADDIAVSLWHSPDKIRMNAFVNSDIRERNLFIWGQEELIISPKFKMQMGLRADYFTHNVNDNIGTAMDSASTGLPHASGYVHQVMISPKLNLVFKPIQNLDIYLNGGSGFHSNDSRGVIIGKKVGELINIYKLKNYPNGQITNELTSNNFDIEQVNSNTLPRAIGSELGIRTKIAKKLHIGFAAWYLHLEKELVYVGDGGVAELSNPTQRIGIDFETRLKLKQWLWLDADICMSEGTVLDVPDNENSIPLAPSITSTGGVTVLHPKGISASVRYRHIGDRPANETNTITAIGYTIINGSISYKIKKFKIFIFAENILDLEWNEAQFDTETRLQNETNSVSEIHFTPGNPRNFQFGVSYLF